MRTSEQIENLRRVMMMTYGPIAIFAPDSVINEWADALQRHVDNIPYFWCIKVRTKENENIKWADIEPEPTNPQCGLETMRKSCLKLLDKYPKILEIEIGIIGSTEDRYLIKREEKNGN